MVGAVGGVHGHSSTMANNIQALGNGNGQTVGANGGATAGGANAGAVAGGANANAGTTANGDTVTIDGQQIPTNFSNHGQEVSWAAHHGIHGQDLSQIAQGNETPQQYYQNLQNQQNAGQNNNDQNEAQFISDYLAKNNLQPTQTNVQQAIQAYYQQQDQQPGAAQQPVAAAAPVAAAPANAQPANA